MREAGAAIPLPVLWLIAQDQAGKTSIVRALTGSENAEINNGFQPQTRTARFTIFPPEAPVVRFLDTPWLAETAYDPGEIICHCESRHFVARRMKATDIRQTQCSRVLRGFASGILEWLGSFAPDRFA